MTHFTTTATTRSTHICFIKKHQTLLLINNAGVVFQSPGLPIGFGEDFSVAAFSSAFSNHRIVFILPSITSAICIPVGSLTVSSVVTVLSFETGSGWPGLNPNNDHLITLGDVFGVDNETNSLPAFNRIHTLFLREYHLHSLR